MIDSPARIQEAKRQARADARRGAVCDPSGFTGESVKAYRAAFIAFHAFTYRGVNAERQTGGGWTGARLRWTARLDDGTRLASDTKEGMRHAIRDALA